jgi:hypothetical protein
VKGQTVQTVRAIVGKLRRRTKYQLMRLVHVNVLDSYTDDPPSRQAALDIFKGEFVSQMPPEHADLHAGTVPLFDDQRIAWLADRLDLSGNDVLELGSLEGGHSYMLQKFGVARVAAVESNSRAYLKSLVVKEIFDLERVDLLYGNFVGYLRETPRRFDLCIASGVLYHMQHPIELIALIAGVTDKAFFWTHYYDADVIDKDPTVRARFSPAAPATHDGLSFPVHRYSYGSEALSSQTFCGGSAEFSYWMERDDILACLRHYGFTEIEIEFDHADHQNGPSFAILAERR